MHEPGWYPDPSGPDGHFRWWDGRKWTDEVRDGPRSGLDAILDAGSAPQATPDARVVGYGTLSIALIAIIAGLATVVGATIGYTSPPPRANPQVPAPTVPVKTLATPPPSSRSTPEPVSASAMPKPESSGHDVAGVAPTCDGVPDDDTRLSDGSLALQAGEVWARQSVPDWLDCGQGGQLLAGEGTAELWVGRVTDPNLKQGTLEAASSTLFDQAVKQLGTSRTLTQESKSTKVSGHDAYQVTGTVGGGQEPTQRVAVLVVNTNPAMPTVVTSVTDINDGEGMRATEAALNSLSTVAP